MRLLTPQQEDLGATSPKPGAKALRRFIQAASAIDALIDRSSPRAGIDDQRPAPMRSSAALDAALDRLFDTETGIRPKAFRRIFQTALCDPSLAKRLSHLLDRSRRPA